MEALLKLPENWAVQITNENRDIIKKWFNKGEYFFTTGSFYGVKNGDKFGHGETNAHLISTADFKRLVLGENNFEDYGVWGCAELEEYFKVNNIKGAGSVPIIYTFSNGKWDTNVSCQTLPLQEYLKLLPTEKTETMRNKYEYILKDEKYKIAVEKIVQNDNLPDEQYCGQNLESGCIAIRTLENHNVLDLFFDKVEVSFTSMTSTLKGKLTIQLHPTSQVENLKSNGWKITTEEHVNQIRKYLQCNK